jgi:ESCRT-II complex subunit VPS25
MSAFQKATQAFAPPEFYSFPPFFTLQTVFETREKQLKLWRELVIDYCMVTNSYSVVHSQFPYFRNAAIDRQLDRKGIEAVVESLIKAGNAEWEDGLRTSLRIMWKSPNVLAAEIYAWASTAEILGTVFTIYELHSGEDNQDSGFHGTDPVLIRRAVELLQAANKCVVIAGASREEDGVKFLSAA